MIQAMCEVTQPTPDDRLCDPAAGTGGFLFNAYNYVLERFEKQLDRDQKRALRDEFVECYRPGRTHEREATWSEQTPYGRWRCYDYEDLLKSAKLSLDLFWIKDRSLTDTDSLPEPEVIAAEIADDLEAALEQFTKIAARLRSPATNPN